MAQIRTGDGLIRDADGSWQLLIKVENPTTPASPWKCRKRVHGDTHVGGLIRDIVDAINRENPFNRKVNYAEYELWWPSQRRWLLKHHWLLDKYSVQADAELVFTNRNKLLQIELPNKQRLRMMVNFAADVLSVVRDICYICEIRNHTELSLVKATAREGAVEPVNIDHAQMPYGTFRAPARHGDATNHEVLSSGTKLVDTNNLEYRKLTVLSAQVDPEQLNSPRTLKERVAQTCRFLDSLKSLMEQGVVANELMKLRFKYFHFDQLSERNDFIRVHQLFEQLKYTILADEFPVTEDQALTLAALQYYVDDCAKNKILDDRPEAPSEHNCSFDIDNMLDTLESELEGKPKDQQDLPTVPELSDLVRVYHPGRLLSLGKFQDKKWLIYKDTTMQGFKTREEAAVNVNGSLRVEIKRAELSKETSVKANTFIIKIKPHDSDEIWLKFDRESQFCRWYAALKLGCKGTTMASNSYKSEIDKLKQVIKIQDPPLDKVDDPDRLAAVRTKFYVSKKFYKKLGHAKIASHILSHQSKIADTVRSQPTVAKMSYIHVWEHIEHSGRAYFQVSFKKDSKKDEFVALSSEMIMRLDSSGKIVQSWWLQTLREWKINWAAEPKRVELFFNKDGDKSDKVEFFISHRSSDSSAIKDLQVIHEYIGGYMFHHMTKVQEPDSAEDVKLRSLLDVADPWHVAK